MASLHAAAPWVSGPLRTATPRGRRTTVADCSAIANPGRSVGLGGSDRSGHPAVCFRETMTIGPVRVGPASSHPLGLGFASAPSSGHRTSAFRRLGSPMKACQTSPRQPIDRRIADRRIADRRIADHRIASLRPACYRPDCRRAISLPIRDRPSLALGCCPPAILDRQGVLAGLVERARWAALDVVRPWLLRCPTRAVRLPNCWAN